MPRQPRYNLTGVAQHVIQRGNNRQAVFFSDEDYRTYLEHLKAAEDRNRCDLHAYVLMTTYPSATRERGEPSWGHAQIFRTVPPANTLVRRVDKSAFAAIVPARPCPAFGRPVHHRGRPLDYGPVLLRKPFRSHLTVGTLPSGCLLDSAANVGPALAVSAVSSCVPV